MDGFVKFCMNTIESLKKNWIRRPKRFIEAVDLQKDVGFAAKVFKTSLFIQSSEKPFYTCIIKVPNKEGYEKLMANMQGAENQGKQNDDSYMDEHLGIHNNECNFYEHFRNLSEFPVPKVFYSEKYDPANKQNGMIFMEDLSEVAKAQGFVQSLKIDQVKKLVDILASFHAYQLSQSNAEWHGVLKKSQTESDAHQEIIKSIQNVEANNNSLYAKQIGELENTFFNQKSMVYFVEGICKELGSPAVDLARLLVTSVDAEVRRELETFIFEYYIEKLTEAMKKPPEFDAGKFKTAYEFAFINQCTAVMMLPPYFQVLSQDASDERKPVYEAQIAKLEVRARLAIEDAIKIAKKHKEHWAIKL
uniref:CHK kinase-like domain-containing protein n=1 Tax=Acrobeloides nanus TaxID=290746 RepID=A0A914DZT0_9BILA